MALKSDTGTHYRVAGVFALAFAAASITTLAGIFVLDVSAMQLSPAFTLETTPDASWPAQWMAGAVSIAAQQNDAAEQWLHLVIIFGGVAAGVSCMNALIGFLSHSNERRYEMAVRGLIGAAPLTLRRRLLRDAGLNALLGIGSGAPIGIACALFIRQTWQGSINAAASLSSWMLVAAVVCVAVAVWAARAAAQRLRRPNWLGDALAPEARTVPGFGAEDLRSLLTTAQIGCAVALSTLGLLLWSYASVALASAADVRSGVYVARMAAPLDPGLIASFSSFPGVKAESIASPGALLGIGKTDKVIADCGRCTRASMYTPMFPVETQQHVVGPRFFEVAGIPIRAGREFADAPDDARGAVINSTFARMAFDDPNPIGKRLLVGGFDDGTWYHVIGVAGDVPTIGLHSLPPEAGALVPASTGSIAPAIYLSARTHLPAVLDIIVKAEEQPQFAGLKFEPLATVMVRASAPQHWFARIVMMLGIALCCVALTGSFTATMLNVRSRQTEIAVRRSVGARRRDIWLLVYRSVGIVAGRGILAGLIVSMALSRAVETVVSGLPVFDAGTMLRVTIAFITLAALAAVLPVRAALRISPAQSQ